MSTTALEQLRRNRDECLKRMEDASRRLQALPPDAPEQEIEALRGIFEAERGAVERLTDDIRREEIVLKARSELKPQDEDEPAAKRNVKVTKEPLVYERHNSNFFFRDVRDASKGDMDAQQRLKRHQVQMQVEMRDINTTATSGGEFVAPLYLQEQWITLARAGRVTANLMNNRELPPGTNSIVLPKLSTGSATAIQTADNAAVQETDPVTASVTVPVRTIAGQVDLSRQLFDLSQPGMDEIIMEDLAADYATKLDIQVISGSGLSGQAKGIRTVSSINSVTYTDSTPTVGELYPKIADAWQRIGASIYRPADVIVMHPRRWAFFAGAVDSSGRPLASAEAPQNAVARNGAIVAEGLAGSMMGLPVYVDPNIPTNLGTNTREDVILVLRSSELYLYERGAPYTRVFEDIGSGTLTVRISLWNYFAFSGERYPGAISTVGGTGMDPPTF